MRSFVVGSRGSRLALAQAEWVKGKLSEVDPNISLRIAVVKTTGDVRSDPLSVIGGKGVFTKELEDALLDRRIHLAVHSLKDLPTSLPQGLTLAAICEREDPHDALVVRRNHPPPISLASLPREAVVGTSSLRRLAQLKFFRPDLRVEDIRGNVDTRLRKLETGAYDALILAVAGLRRLDLKDRISATLTIDEMLPAVGQGALALEVREDDKETLALAKKLDHEPTHLACTAERSLLRTLGGGCQLPIAAHAELISGQLNLRALVANKDGSQIVSDRITGSTKDAEEIGLLLGKKMLEAGARELLMMNG